MFSSSTPGRRNRGVRLAPGEPEDCTFSRVSVNYSADLETRVQPCFFGGNPDCSQCGCAVSAGLHWLREQPLAFGLRARHLIDASLAIGHVDRAAPGVQDSGRRMQTT